MSDVVDIASRRRQKPKQALRGVALRLAGDVLTIAGGGRTLELVLGEVAEIQVRIEGLTDDRGATMPHVRLYPTAEALEIVDLSRRSRRSPVHGLSAPILRVRAWPDGVVTITPDLAAHGVLVVLARTSNRESSGEVLRVDFAVADQPEGGSR